MGEDCACIDEKTDKVSKQPEVTAWKRAARRHQCEWRESKGMAQGESPTRLTEPDGDRGRNFLCPESEAAARARFAKFADPRLKGDLLSSMPMCFNLFGPLAQDPRIAAKAVKAWFPDLWIPGAGVEVEVKFEYAPKPKNEFLNDNTAFDVAFFIIKRDKRTRTHEQAHLIGIETKYHEHPKRESLSPNGLYEHVSRRAGQPSSVLPRIKEISGVQLWRNHLLALACGQHRNAGWDKVKHVLVAPQGNPAWPALANDYLTTIPNAADTFEFRTIEQLLDAVPGLLPQEPAFRERYLDVTPV